MPDSNSDQLLFLALLDVYERMGMTVRFESLNIEDIKSRGGRCRVREKEIIIIDTGLSLNEKIDMLVVELRRFPYENIYLPPNVRQAVERVTGEKI
jgi:hypothetical protein